MDFISTPPGEQHCQHDANCNGGQEVNSSLCTRIQFGILDFRIMIVFLVFHVFLSEAEAPFGLVLCSLQNFSVNPVTNLGCIPAIFLLAAQVGAGQMTENISITFCTNANNFPCITNVNNCFVEKLLICHVVSFVTQNNYLRW